MTYLLLILCMTAFLTLATIAYHASYTLKKDLENDKYKVKMNKL